MSDANTPEFQQSQIFQFKSPLLPVIPPLLPVIQGFRRYNQLERGIGRLGTLEVRLARSATDILRAQRLRYAVFYEEMAAKPTLSNRLLRRDADAYDAYCDHLLVFDHAATSGHLRRPKLVGTYRLLRQEIASLYKGFYTASEYDIAPLLARHPSTRFLELGRSCVAPAYRDKRTVELLWHGIWTYVRHHKIDAMFGCASFSGTDTDALAVPLSFLHHKALAPTEWQVKARPERLIPMDSLALTSIDHRAALALLPPLIKGYLRVGARFGEGAVIDQQFGTTDVLVILPVESIQARYINHFGHEAERFAA